MKKPTPKSVSSSKRKKTMTLTAFTRGGLGSLLHTYTTKLGCTVTREAEETKDGTNRWTAIITEPVLDLSFEK